MSRKAQKMKRDRRAEAHAFDRAVGERIQGMRVARRLKQAELGELIGFAGGAQISRYESGTASCEPYTLALIAKVLTCKVSEFLDGIEV